MIRNRNKKRKMRRKVRIARKMKRKRKKRRQLKTRMTRRRRKSRRIKIARNLTATMPKIKIKMLPLMRRMKRCTMRRTSRLKTPKQEKSKRLTKRNLFSSRTLFKP